MHASNFRKIKRVEDVVRIFYKVRKTDTSKTIDVVGDGPERPADGKTCARELDLHDDMRFVGKQEQMEDILLIADLFLLTREYESFGLAALGSNGSSVPVYQSNAGGLPEININDYCGFLSNVGDIDDMCKNTLYILSDEERLKEFKHNALQQAIKFDINNIVPGV